MIPRRRAHTYPGEFEDIARWARAGDKPDAGVVQAWECAVAELVGMPQAAVVNSGRRGMALIFEHLGIGPGDEVIVPAYTLKDLIPLLQRTGAAVVPADIDPETLSVTAEAIERRLTPKTKAVLVLHAFGSPCPIEEIVALTEGHGIPVVEDCAHSLGATVEGRQTGRFGYAGFFSFETTKPVNTFGGGMVVSRDRALIEAVRQATAGDGPDLGPFTKKVRATRMERVVFTTRLAWPLLFFLASPMTRSWLNRLYRRVQHAPPSDVRYSSVQAQLGLKKLATLADRIRLREEKADLLRSLLKPDIRVQRVPAGCRSTWYVFVVVLPRESLLARRRMLVHGVDAGIEDEIADNCAALLGYSDCPNVEAVYSRAMVLPLYEDLGEAAVRRVARVVNGLVS